MCFRVLFSLNNQTIIDICPLARSQEEEHPERRKARLASGWLRRKARYFVSSPHG